MPIRGNCPHCVAPYFLDDELFRKAAGKQARCDSCGQFFRLPAPVRPLAYETPPALAAPAAGDCWQVEMKYLVMRDHGATPDRCVKCNAPAKGFWLAKKFRPPATSGGGGGGIFALIGLVFLIIEMSTQKTIRVRLALCPAHRARRKRQLWMAWGLVLLAPILAAVGLSMFGDAAHRHADHQALGITLFSVGLACLLGGIIWAAMAAQVLGYYRMDDQRIWLKWAGKRFLESLESS